MKKLGFLLLTLFWMVSGHMLAQSRFRVTFEAKDATCYNNGRVVFALLNENNEILETLPPELSQVRIYYKLNETDTAHYSGWYYTGGKDSLTLNYGTYIVGVNGLLEEEGGYSTIDTQVVLTINTLYGIPTVGVVEGNATLGTNEPGTISTFSCVDVGRVQLQITGGQFPYIVTVRNHNTGDTLRTMVFNSNLYSGTQKDRYDYKDYYSIDSLPGGDWDFYVEDGCGYGLPYVTKTVYTSTLPTPSLLFIFASSGNFADSNILRLRLSYDLYVNSIQDLLTAHAKYRFTHGETTTEWKPMEFATIVGFYGIFYDTINTANKYCDIWDRPITFDYKVENCGFASSSFTFTIQKPNEIYFQRDTTEVSDSIKIIDNCMKVYYKHRDSHRIRYFNNEMRYNPDNVASVTNERAFHRYHYTHPITWIYKDTKTGNIIKKDTVDNISVWSSLFYEEVKNFYGPSADSILLAYVERKLVDAKGCELFVTQDTLPYPYIRKEECVLWEIENSRSNNCMTDLRTVTVFTKSTLGFQNDNFVVKLVRSPYHNRYNFEATYDHLTKTWTVHKAHIANSAVIVGSADGRSVIIQDIALPSGPYEFEIITNCGTTNVAKNVAFPDIYEMRFLERPEYTIERNCGYINVKYTKGRYERRIHNTSPESGLPTDTATQLIGMGFDVVDAPHPSYLTISRAGSLPLSFAVSMPGRYVIKVRPLNTYSGCEGDIVQYDTLYFDELSVNFVRAVALLCDTSATEGDVYVEAVNGTTPYTYTLYDQPDKQGNILAVNNSGVFRDVPMQSWQTLSCLVSDSCNAYFHVNIQPKTLVTLQKIWFDGGLKTLSACEGSTIQVHALNVGGIMEYNWSGPDGFRDTVAEPYVFLPKGSSSGWYKVSLRQADCGKTISDSIFLTVLEVPDIALSPDTTVCPGETVTVRFTPESPMATNAITFTVAFANQSGVQTRTYTAHSGITVIDTFTTLSETMIYPLSISDERCDYLFSNNEDTLHIFLRDDISPSCSLLTRHDTVCHLGTARLLASSTLPTPYTIYWFGDYGMRNLLKTETITQDNLWTSFDTAQIWQRTHLYVSVQQEGMCPSTYGVAYDTMTLTGGTTELSCGKSYRLFNAIDSGTTISSDTLTHRFYTSQNHNIILKITALNLNPTDYLIIFSGQNLHPDSILCTLTSRNRIPGAIISHGNALTVVSTGKKPEQPSWEAIIESSPGIAIADVRQKNHRKMHDRVCQSRVNSYQDRLGVIPDIVSNEEIDIAIRKAGNYYYSKTFQSVDMNGCDSVVSFTLTVDPPERHTITVTATNLNGEGYRWHDNVYTTGGIYAHLTTLPDGCDYLDILNLTLVEADCPSPNICKGDSTALSIAVSLSDNSHIDSLLKQKIHPGHILCTDGSTLSADAFLVSGKSPKGVVFYVDSTGIHGLAAALTNEPQYTGSNSQKMLMNAFPNLEVALNDLDGQQNTLNYISSLALSYSSEFGSEETDFSYCHFFNHNTLAAGVEPYGWYLPSLGEISLLLSNIHETNSTLQKLKASNSEVKTIGGQLGSSTHFSNGVQWFYNYNAFRYDYTAAERNILPIIKF